MATKNILVAVDDLHFDRENPRLAEYGITNSTKDEEILKILWEAMDVRELVQSIAASGYFQHEPLIVAEEDGRKIVIEGNRRLAAVKVLLGRKLIEKTGWAIPQISAQAHKSLEKLPVIVSGREEAWRYLGFKHVNGPAKWSSYAKAHYIADVHREYSVPLEEIASQIGDTHNTVKKLFRGLMVLEQAERENVYDREDRFRTRLAFSHLYTGLGYDGIMSFLGIETKDVEEQNPVPKEKLLELGEFCVWLYGSKKENTRPVIESQNPDLRNLNAVLGSRQAIAALRADAELPVAYEISRPPTRVFEESLLAAKRELEHARAYLTTGYDNSDELLRISGSVATLADDLYEEMERKQNVGKKKVRLTTD